MFQVDGYKLLRLRLQAVRQRNEPSQLPVHQGSVTDRLHRLDDTEWNPDKEEKHLLCIQAQDHLQLHRSG